MRIIFIGTPDFAVPVLRGLLSGGHQIVAVVTRPDRPAGRGRRLMPPPVKTFAVEHGLALSQPPSLRREVVAQELTEMKPEAMVVAAYGRIIPPEVLAIPTRGVLNIHPSLLPRYRGPSPVVSAILEGEDVTGVTVMLMDQGLDTGPILAQRQASVLPREAAGDLTHRLFTLGAELLLEVLPQWQAGTIQPVPQDEALATSTRLHTKEDGEMDWSQPADALDRRLRAFNPWPGCYTRWAGKLLKVLEGVPAGDADSRESGPGRVVSLPGGGKPSVSVMTGQGLLGLVTVQPEGRQPQAIEDFVRGHPRFLDAVLPS